MDVTQSTASGQELLHRGRIQIRVTPARPGKPGVEMSSQLHLPLNPAWRIPQPGQLFAEPP
jgi:hypothetical protein